MTLSRMPLALLWRTYLVMLVIGVKVLANVERLYAIRRRRGRIANKGIESLLVCVAVALVTCQSCDCEREERQ